MASRKNIPAKKPTEAGRTDVQPSETVISIEGISKDQTEAATITPDAKPSRAFCSSAGISLFIKNTNADPMTVPAKGISSVAMIALSILIDS